MILEACRRADDPESFRRNIEPVPQAPQQQTDFSARSAAVKVRFVEHDKESLIFVLGQPLFRSVDGPH